MSILDKHFEEEKERTKECLADLIQFLSHDTSVTRRQLVETLRQRTQLIADESLADSIRILTGEKDLN